MAADAVILCSLTIVIVRWPLTPELCKKKAMKAAVLHQFGSAPVFEEIPDPVPAEGQLIMSVKAASVKNLDKLRASGTHYASYTSLPAITGIDAVGVLDDGTRVYAQGVNGTIATKALINKEQYLTLPAGIDDITAAALPNAVIGAAMALRYRAAMQPGDTVLINGATGVTGKIAVQVARHYGAGKIIATGRNAALLEELKALGADEIISLKQEDAEIISRLKELHAAHPVNVVIDYLWGHPVSLIITALKGGGLHNITAKVRIVTVGSMAGENIMLPSSVLRSSAIELLGSGIGSLSKEDLQSYHTQVLPEMFELAASGKLQIGTTTAPLADINTAWNAEIEAGKRLVIVM